MLKGVNKLIIEVSNPESELFERAIFFVKPDKSSVITKDMNESVRNIMNEADGIRSFNKLPKTKKRTLLKLAGAAGMGAAVMGFLLKFFG
jgi:hypothetical protein